MDDDDLRRGRPTCHVAFGENVAILAGDALYAEAFRHIVAHQRGEPAALLRAIGRLAGATGVDGMVGGQYLDVDRARPAGPGRAAPAARAEDRAADRRVRRVRARPQRGGRN